MLSGNQLRQKYLDFFASRGHRIIPSAPIVLSGDPTTLFTSSGMQPLVPYLLGKKHPAGNRLVNSQKCIRTQDIEEVGDNRHTTFFEMLGNWSLGDYFKKEQLTWIWEFFIKEISLSKEKLHVTLFEGNNQVPKDEESYQIWKSLGVSDDHIHYYDAKKNWWSRSGTPDQMPVGEPGGPDSEIFYDFGTPHDLKLGENCHPNCDCGRFMEIGNSVFMQYQKQGDSSVKELSQKNVDFGGGLERILSVANNDPDIFNTDLFLPVIHEIEKHSGKNYVKNTSSMRIIADHLKAATFMIAEDLEPSNKQQGYILRRLIRRATLKLLQLDAPPTKAIPSIINAIVKIYMPTYFKESDLYNIHAEIGQEAEKFMATIHRGMKLFELSSRVDEKTAFDLFQSYGFPFELTQELVKEKGINLKKEKFDEIMREHQEKSRTASAGMFRGGLVDHSEVVSQYHTATHLLHQALRDVLGGKVHQAGSNLTSERLRFDFTYDKALTPEELKLVEDAINEKIFANLSVTVTTMPYDAAIKSGALAFFKEKYPEQVTVYQIGDYSRELCGGPHVSRTSEIGKIKIVKQKSLGSSLQRLYLTKVS